MSEIIDRADEIRGIAQSCRTINDLAKRLGWSMEIARHTRDILGLELPDAKLRTGPAKVAQAHPKPVKRK